MAAAIANGLAAAIVVIPTKVHSLILNLIYFLHFAYFNCYHFAYLFDRFKLVIIQFKHSTNSKHDSVSARSRTATSRHRRYCYFGEIGCGHSTNSNSTQNYY